MVLHVVASVDVWIWNALAYAVSQFSTTRLMEWVEPRSTWIHCGSLNALDHRVPVLPSVAALAGYAPLSVEDAVVGLPWDSRLLVPAGDPLTMNSQSEYPHWVPRAVPYILTYRPVPVTDRASVPPSPG